MELLKLRTPIDKDIARFRRGRGFRPSGDKDKLFLEKLFDDQSGTLLGIESNADIEHTVAEQFHDCAIGMRFGAKGDLARSGSHPLKPARQEMTPKRIVSADPDLSRK